ncbi:uncharacterized protein LOC125740327 [Brienomyrus brachyistius]|uniref:uncharacterized protein LOC125740327 n=1 Tax=Brienomyrus brachyistius TaxID=42636 RepID=UPI0020B1D1D5|nr:uncharacterized protein LOC125740327 [Brienomyrus brachyistius]XP_048867251.1 uncharacterized protein LOC125740327 [Brienomyrus brachyistius]XP_048867252.1 uncharacterized protein LOC125740327 [Brienomyrus brachyistius]XP_048867253.1 uncharacterized protein LOC125740327 [Brienomyrus brachyistius]
MQLPLAQMALMELPEELHNLERSQFQVQSRLRVKRERRKQTSHSRQNTKLWVLVGLTAMILVMLMIYQALQVWGHSRTTGQVRSEQLTSLTQPCPLMLNNLSDNNERKRREVGRRYGSEESEQIVEYYQDEIDLEGLAKRTLGNWWYKWAKYTAASLGQEGCVLCAGPDPSVRVVLFPYTNKRCEEWEMERIMRFWKSLCQEGPAPEKDCRPISNQSERIPYCPYKCLIYQGNTKYAYRVEKHCGQFKPWEGGQQDIMVNKLSFFKGLIYECFTNDGPEEVGIFWGTCGTVWDVKGPRVPNGELSRVPLDALENQSVPLADVWWLCGKEGGLRPTLPYNWGGLCARVMLASQVDIYSRRRPSRSRRFVANYEKDPNVYIDAIGQPRGIPEKYQARSEIAAGFESILIWPTLNKNVEWINYLYYNQQRFTNYTQGALASLGEQLQATSLMTWQNRMALDWLLAEKGGVCVLFGDQCCTFIPNNTAPDGSFTKAMRKLQGLQDEMASNAGQHDGLFDWWYDMWGNWQQALMKALCVGAVLISALLLIFCCIVPLVRSLVGRALSRQATIAAMSRVVGGPFGAASSWTNTEMDGDIDTLDAVLPIAEVRPFRV